MFQKILHFIKYNNAAVIILAIILILGGGALAAGPEAVGQKQTSVEGLDNTALLSVDLNAFNMDFKIENIEQDEKYYYVTYSFLDLAVINQVWQYQLSQKTQKVSKKIKEDIGVYTAKFLAKHYEARMRELKQEKSRAEALGEQTRVEVTEYSGLIGKTLDLAAKVFPGYEPVVKRELPTPLFVIPAPAGIQGLNSPSPADNLTKIYNDYIAAHPEIFAAPTPTDSTGSPPADTASSTPDSAGSPQADSTAPGDTAAAETPVTTETPADSAGSPQADSAGSPQAIPEPESVEIIELPASPAGEPAPAPVEPVAPVEPAPAQ